jgi:hypothetical protein
VKALHLATRFFGSLRSGAPREEAWAIDQLVEGERAVWERMSDADRRHAVGVALRVGDALGERATRPVLAAALLHDSGKVESDLGTFARVGATVAGVVSRRWRGRVGAYLRHDEIGAEMLERAGSDALTVAWAREHHLPRARWTLPLDIADALKAADDD